MTVRLLNVENSQVNSTRWVDWRNCFTHHTWGDKWYQHGGCECLLHYMNSRSPKNQDQVKKLRKTKNKATMEGNNARKLRNEVKFDFKWRCHQVLPLPTSLDVSTKCCQVNASNQRYHVNRKERLIILQWWICLPTHLRVIHTPAQMHMHAAAAQKPFYR